MSDDRDRIDRRSFLRISVGMAGGFFFAGGAIRVARSAPGGKTYEWDRFQWAYAVDTTKCIGCGSCMRACRAENHVPEGYFRTWVERYEIDAEGEAHVQVATGKDASFEADGLPASVERIKGFFVPKLCNHCKQSVCTQVCPVSASYRTPDGVVLIDGKRCVGCGYCVQACPYGTRYMNPATHTADKCSLCYHRITKGMPPACVLACPVGARMYGNLKDHRGELYRILRQRRYTLLKPELGTHPQAFYIGLDQEVK